MVKCVIHITLADGLSFSHEGLYPDPVEAALVASQAFPDASKISVEAV